MVLEYGDPRRRIDADLSRTSATMRIVQYDADDGEPLKVGNYSAMNRQATIFLGGNHHLDWVGVLNAEWPGGVVGGAAKGAPTSRGQVVIGSDVFVGYEALIMSGVHIGDGAAVAAGAVVMRNVQPYEIVGGNPSRHLGWRFDEPTREALLRIRWWDWPHEQVVAHMDEINSPDVAGFIAKYDPVPVAL